MADTELIGCPFCGGAARIEMNGGWLDLRAQHENDCLLAGDGPEMLYMDEAGAREKMISKWNRRAAAAPADAPTAPMCERKTNDIIQREGYKKTGYVLRKEGADICVSDGGAVAWFTPEQWNWLMFNRMHTTFDWPKPIGWRAPAEDAREEVQDAAQIAADAFSLAWSTALDSVAFYVAGHCADGDFHAEQILGMPAPAFKFRGEVAPPGRAASTPAVSGTPEGFVLLPESPTNEMICAIEAAIDSQLVASAMSPAQMFRQDGERIYEALLEVAAPSHPLEAKAGGEA